MSLYLGSTPIGKVSVLTEESKDNTSDATLSSGEQMLEGVTAYSKGVKYTGEILTKTSNDVIIDGNIVTIPDGYYSDEIEKSVELTSVATPSINVSNNGLITASINQSTGYVVGENKSTTQQLSTQGAQTITPSTQNQTISSGKYITGTQTIKGDSNLISNNIKKDVSIFGITGTYEAVSTGGVPSNITAGDTTVLSSSTLAYTTTSTSMSKTGISISIPKSGTYRFKFSCGRTSTSGTWTAQLYKNSSAVSGATATWSQYQGTCSADITCNAGDTIEIYARSRGSNYRAIIGQLVACINWNNGF